MPSFTPLNTSDSYLVKELNTRDINKIIKDALSFTNPLNSLPRE